MRLLILSDIHDHIDHLRRLLARKISCDAVLGCGDYCAPFIIRLLGQGFDCPIHLVFGNNDGDRAMQTAVAAGFSHIELSGEFLDRSFGGSRVFINHYPGIARGVAEAGKHELVCYGHDHQQYEEKVGDTLLLNPGSVMGYQPSKDAFVAPTVALYDTEKRVVEILEI